MNMTHGTSPRPGYEVTLLDLSNDLAEKFAVRVSGPGGESTDGEHFDATVVCPAFPGITAYDMARKVANTAHRIIVTTAHTADTAFEVAAEEIMYASEQVA